MDLKQYEQEKFAIADILRSAQAIDSRDESLSSECRDLLTRLAEDRFNLLVVGRFNRGKSTLMNAVLGGDHLPTGIVPLTSVITTIRYGSRKQVVLNFTDSGFRREVPITQLAECVTQQGNPGNIKKVAYAEIELPVEILRRGLFFVDSPGLGSSIVENTETTERFLPQADAFVLVTSFESPLSEEEDRILHRIRTTNKKLFLVVNKKDTASAEERKQVVEFISERLKRFSFSEMPHIFAISARQALDAKMSGRAEDLDDSGLPSFEAELLNFLTEERAQLFLSNMYARTTTLLAQRSRSEGSEAKENPYLQLMQRLRELRETSISIDARPAPSTSTLDSDSKLSPVLHIDPKTGCSICGSILASIFEFLSKYQYDLTIKPETQHEHAIRGGFCPLHTWQYENVASPYGVCTAYPELAHRIAHQLDRAASEASQPNSSLDGIWGFLSTVETCLVCDTRIRAEQRAVNAVADEVRGAAISSDHRLPACCLPHLAAVVGNLGSGQASADLLRSHARLLERTAEDLQRNALRHDALRRYLTSEEERRASLLTLLLLAGHRSVNAPWNIESVGSN